MAASGSAVLFGGDDTLIISGQSPTVLPIDSIDFDSNVTVVGNTFQFDDDGDQVLSVSMKAAAGSNQTVAYTLQLYDNTSSSVVASYSSEAPGGAQGAAQQLLQLVFTADSTHTYSLRILVPSGGDPAMALLGPTFQAVITTLAGGGGGGTVGPGTTNYLAKFTAATVIGDSSFTNPSAGALGVGNDVAISITAGTVSAGTTGRSITLTASAAKAGSNANGGDINLAPGAKDGSGTDGIISLGVGNSWIERGGAGYFYSGGYGVSIGIRSDRGFGTPGSGYISVIASVNSFTFGSGSIVAGSGVQYGWSANPEAGSAAPDTGLGRSAAGRVNITNGSTTNYLTLGVNTGSNSLIKCPNATSSGAGSSLTISGSNADTLGSGGSILILPGTGAGGSNNGQVNMGAAPTTAAVLAEVVIGTTGTGRKGLVIQTVASPANNASNPLEVQTSDGRAYFVIPRIAGSLSGVQNNVSGLEAGIALTTGTLNSIYGASAGLNTNDVSECVFIGSFSGRYFNAERNVAIGSDALSGSSTVGDNIGTGNVAVGYRAGFANQLEENIYVGYEAGLANQTSTSNVLIGSGVASTLTSGNGENVVIGPYTDVASVSTDSAVVIGGSSTGESSSVIIGYNVISSVANDFQIRSGDTGISRVAANILKPYDGTNNGWFQNAAGCARVTSQFDKTDATLDSITGLSWTLTAGRSYSFMIVLIYGGAGISSGGIKVDLGGGTATATTINATGVTSINGASPIAVNVTTLTGALANNNGATYINTVIYGTITVNAGGTFNPRFAQNSASSTSSVLVGSYGFLEDMP